MHIDFGRLARRGDAGVGQGFAIVCKVDIPADQDSSIRQRYKPWLADEANASALQIHCMLETLNHDEVSGGEGTAMYEVVYTLYLGANHTDDFTVLRNHRYDVAITITGPIRNTSGSVGTYNFDARVNMEDQDYNRYHLSILRERRHDAHFCVTPMDIYFFNNEDLDPKLVIAVEDGCDWIRIERIPAENMAQGTVPTDKTNTNLETRTPWTAGNGKRKYFTTGLMNELPASVEVTSNRDRVYFYIDENLTDRERTAQIRLLYFDDYYRGTDEYKNGVPSTLTRGQLPLLEVTVPVKDENGDPTGDSTVIYMEQIEEYLEYYDPLETPSSQMQYEGLAWGFDGMDIERICRRQGNGVGDWFQKPQDNYTDGYHYSAWLMSEEYTEQRDMTLNTIPRNAVEYCHNRNKRNSEGTIPVEFSKIRSWGIQYWTEWENKSKWFLPGITEMEEALTQYYNRFGEFQHNFYWSSSAGKKWGLGYPLDREYARATKVIEPPYDIDNDGKIDRYAISDWDDDYAPGGDRGKARRIERFRIRAFRIDKEPYGY